ncbi:MAG TPA: pantetheine-phosphate adenylyltransferase [Chloroflexi bacterium]|nr:pantetheine-phosphate adenylyltransferase [Chloroflexota bacterium]
MERVAIYPGSFDPIHYGHIDIAERAAKLFDRLIVAVYARPNKRLWFEPEERVALARQALAHLANVEVLTYDNLTVTFAEAVGAQALVRGLRVISDFELEYQMALTNHQLSPQMETICLMTRHEYAFLSASIVKEVLALGGDVSGMTPPHVVAALGQRAIVRNRQGESEAPSISIRD